VPDFITPTIANGKVFVATESQLLVYGLLPSLTVTAGNNQSGDVGKSLPLALFCAGAQFYTGQPVVGAASPSAPFPPVHIRKSHATRTAAGIATSTYTLPTKPGAVTITASGDSPSTTTTAYFGETANVGPPTSLVLVSGGKQRGTVGTTYPHLSSSPSKILTATPYRAFSKFRRQRGRHLLSESSKFQLPG